MSSNQVILNGTIVELDALRHTPAGIPILKFRIAHESAQTESGTERKVGCEIAAVAFEREAKLAATMPLGSAVTVTGFLERKGRSSRTLVLHAKQIEFN